MENKKIILEEINRIREVMGLNYRNVIMEQPNPQILQKGRPYVEKILESFGFKSLDTATQTNARKILTDFQSVLNKSAVKPGAEIEEAINLALKRDGINPATNKVFKGGAERLDYVLGKMEQNIDDLEKSLSAAEQNASKALDRMFVEISQTTSGRNIESQMNNLMVRRGQSKNSAIGFLKTRPEYSSIPDWYWKRLENLKEFEDSTTRRKYVDFDNDPINASAIEKVEAGEGKLKEVWEKMYSSGDEVTLEQAFQNEQIRKALDDSPLFRRATPEQQEKIRETMVSTANEFISKYTGKFSVTNADSQIDNLIELFESYTLNPQQKKNLINYAIKQNGVKYPWLPNPFAEGGVENILRQASLKDQNGQSIFSGSRYKKLIDEPGPNWMKERGDIKIFATQFFKLSAVYWLNNILFSTGFAIIEAIRTFDDPNFDIDNISNNTIIGFAQRAEAVDWLLRAAFPLPVVYSATLKEVIGMTGEGFLENDRMASFDEIFESPEWKFEGKKEPGEYIKKKGSESPDIIDTDKKEEIDKYTNYIVGVDGKNYGIWYYSEKDDIAKIYREPVINAAKITTKTPSGKYKDEVDSFKEWYKNRGGDFANVDLSKAGKDANGYYVDPSFKKRFVFKDASVGFDKK